MEYDIVEKFPCIEKNEADVRERYWIDHFKSQLNSWIPSRTKEEWKNDNKEIITGKKKERYEKNKKELVEYHKEDYEKNKKELLEKMKEKIQCECGCFSTKTHLLRHQKSKKHLDLMSTKII